MADGTIISELPTILYNLNNKSESKRFNPNKIIKAGFLYGNLIWAVNRKGIFILNADKMCVLKEIPLENDIE